MADFANILFSGRCNARCPYCIGKQIDPSLNRDNLDLYPPRNLDRFLSLIREHQVRQVVLTGTDTDPQLYRHEGRLLAHLRRVLPAGTAFSLHTNGRLALGKMALVNGYDRVAISIPSFDPEVYERMMGVPGVPDLGAILGRAKVPVKVSCVITDDNRGGVPRFLEECRSLGVRRLVLRKLMGEGRSWDGLIRLGEIGLALRSVYRGNPVYAWGDMEVTLWDFGRTESRSLNLFSSGRISTAYLLTEAHASGEDEPGP
jgi:MoaA/NifB/PqqE/SkfB family radical SAM enzyme